MCEKSVQKEINIAKTLEIVRVTFLRHATSLNPHASLRKLSILETEGELVIEIRTFDSFDDMRSSIVLFCRQAAALSLPQNHNSVTASSIMGWYRAAHAGVHSKASTTERRY